MTWEARIRDEFARLGKHPDDSVVDELAQHAAAAYETTRADGASPTDAEAEVRELVASWCAGTTGPRRLERAVTAEAGSTARSGLSAFFQDVRFGARVLARSPGLSLVVLLTIAFGAGLNAAVFVQFNDAFLRPPDLRNAGTLVWLDDGGARTGALTYPDYADYRDRVQAIDLALFTGGARKWTIGQDAEERHLSVALASGNYFRVLQVPAALGRTFGPSDDLPPLGTSVAVLSDGYW